MGVVEALALLISSIIVPYLVALIRNEVITGSVARWLAIAISIIAGIIAGLFGGVPATVGDWVTFIVAAVGGTQIAYTVFKSIGVTNKWLDALMEVGTKKEDVKVGGSDD